MSLLDAALAFALTMAALATVVTIIMEIVMRVCGLKAKDQVKLIGKLVEDVVQARFGKMNYEQKWSAVRGVLNNAVLPENKQMADAKVRQFFIFGQARNIYDDVSLEHVLRRILEIKGLGIDLRAPTQLRVKLKSVALKYREWRSAVAVHAARRARFWSLIVGVVLAVVLNVDGLRLFEAFASNPQLTDSVIEEMDPTVDAADAASKSLAETLEKAGETEASAEELQEAINGLKAELGVVRQLGLPIGKEYFPYCYLSDGVNTASEQTRLDRLCEPAKAIFWDRWQDYGGWALRILITGLLMGLGAPFWYDVARRLAQVRQAFGAKGGAAERHRGSEGDESPKAMDELIDRIVEDAVTGASLLGESSSAQGSSPGGS